MAWQPTPVFLPGESQGQRSLAGYSPWGCKESDTTERLHFLSLSRSIQGFPGGSEGNESACNAGDVGFIPGLRRSPGGWHGNPLQYSCLENPQGQRSLVGYGPWGWRVRHDWATFTYNLGASAGLNPIRRYSVIRSGDPHEIKRLRSTVSAPLSCSVTDTLHLAPSQTPVNTVHQLLFSFLGEEALNEYLKTKSVTLEY